MLGEYNLYFLPGSSFNPEKDTEFHSFNEAIGLKWPLHQLFWKGEEIKPDIDEPFNLADDVQDFTEQPPSNTQHRKTHMWTNCFRYSNIIEASPAVLRGFEWWCQLHQA
jgi:hypothetical protein